MSRQHCVIGVAFVATSLLFVATPTAAQETKPHWLILPAIGSAPETGAQFGAVVMRVSRPEGAARPSVNQGYVLATAKHQYQGSLEHDGWSPDARWHHYAKLDLLDYPLPFYGIGAHAPESAEEWFTSRTVQVQGKLQRRLSGAWYGMAIARVVHTAIRDVEPGRAIASGALRGATGGTLVQPGVGVVYDTRDDVLAAESGRYLEASFAVADGALGSDFSTNQTVVDARAFRRAGAGVVAVQAFVDLNAGAPSFDQMSLVGNSNVLRGYARGRYRDRALAAMQVEWRSPMWKQWRYAVFGGIGAIGATPAKLGAVTLPTYGAGLRFRVFKAERSAIRLDYARGRSGASGLYISLNEAF